CPRLSLLVTSRERLRLRAEHIYEVAPLPLPAASERDPGLLEGSPAVQLFLRRAAAADPAFVVDGPGLVAMAEICRRLDGLPLAIELAAARVTLLPPAALLARLARPLPLLTGGPRDAPSRQQTMRAAIAWSADLLPPETRRLYARLGAFPASFSLPAAQSVAAAVANAPGDDDPALALLEGLEDLLHKHLLRRAGTDPAAPRFAMLTVIREYAAELLASADDAPLVRARHALFYAGLADQLAPLLTGAGAATALAALEEEHPNLRAALARQLAAGEGDMALRLTGALWRFWWQRGHLSEGRTWLAQALAAPAGGDASARAAALDADGVLAFAQGNFAAAGERHTEALNLARRSDDAAAAARALLNLGTLADEQGQTAEAARYLEEALVASRAAGDARAVAVALANLGQVAMSLADYPRAAALLNESALAFRNLGDARSEAAILANLGLMSLMAGDAAAAQRCHAAALSAFEELGDAPALATETLNLGHALQHLGDWDAAESLMHDARRRFADMDDRSGLAFADLHLGKLALLRGDHNRAEQRLTLALRAAEEIGDWVAAAESLEGMAMLLGDTGIPQRAAQALGAAEALRESLEVPLPAIHAPALAQCTAALAAALDLEALEAAKAQGAAEAQRALALPGDGLMLGLTARVS
ncbi:MAG: tetratricopeptide repeat protein, partial [Thermomicrobiales bacterium]